MFAPDTVKPSQEILTFQHYGWSDNHESFPLPSSHGHAMANHSPLLLYHLFHKSCNECNPSSISFRDRPMKAIGDCPIAFKSQNKLVDIFANYLAERYIGKTPF